VAIHIRLLILASGFRVLWELQKAYGGWCALLREAWLGIPRWRLVHIRAKAKTVPRTIRNLTRRQN
jgi:hypothetical protein